MSNYKIPKGEKSWLLCTNEAEEQYIITSKEFDRSNYFLYKVLGNGKLEKISRNSDPRKFDLIIFGTKHQ